MPKAQLQYLTDELSKLREQKLYQKLRILETEQLPVANFDGKEVINLSSNNYLGLTTHPKLKEAAVQAVEEFGVGSGSVRTIAGTMTLHMELEQRIARFKQVDACVVFQSGFAANAGTVQAILGKEDVIDRKSTRLNSSHGYISYAVFCLKKKKRKKDIGDSM